MESKGYISGWQTGIVERLSLKSLFIIAVLVGTIFTVVGSQINSTFLGFWVPVSIILIYCTIVWHGSSDVPPVIAGDSCYYLGFIFTLISLIASLLLLSEGPEAGKVNFSQIVSSFGVALVTTVIGLIARLLITSFDIETKQRQVQIERDIEQSLEVFKGQIDVLINTVTSSVIKVSAETQQVIIGTLQEYEKVNSNVLEKFEASFDECQVKFTNAVNNLTDKVNSIEVSKDVITKPVLESIKDLTDNLAGFSHSFTIGAKQLQSNNEQLAYHIAGSTDTINKHINGFEAQLNIVVNEQANSYRQTLTEIGDAVLSSIGDIKDFKLEVEDNISSKVETLSTQFADLSSAMDISIPALTSSMKTLFDESSIIHAQLADSPKIIQTYITGLNELSEKFKALATNIPQLESFTEQLSKFEALLEVSSKRTLETYKRFDESAATTEEYTNQVAKDISTVYSNLAQEIQKLRGAAA
jgi:hypothetical protein